MKALRYFWVGLIIGATLTAHATTYNSDGSVSNINTLIAGASSGDTVTVPAGSFTWAASVNLSKAVTLQGAGQGVTNITISSSGQNVLYLTTPANITGFTFTQSSGTSSLVATTASAKGFRFYYNTYVGTGTSSVSTFHIVGSKALIDHNTITDDPSAEIIWCTDDNGAAGLNLNGSSSWQYAAPYGTNDAVYVENCTFAGQCALSDVGYGGKLVFRFNTMTDPMKLDMHDSYFCPGNGNGTGNGGRMLEAYGNTWAGFAYSNAMFIRGGTGMYFNNTSDQSDPTWPYIEMRDYHLTNHASQISYKTPLDYLIIEQVGAGIYPSGVEPVYFFRNTKAGGIPWVYTVTVPMGGATFVTDSAGYSIGATVINISGGAQSGYNPDPDGYTVFANVDYVAFAGDTNRYQVSVDHTGSSGTLTLKSPGLLKAIPASATGVTIGTVVNYQGRTGNPSATFVSTDIIAPDRDVFSDIYGTGGVGTGTKAQMLASSPSVVGQGWWVTNEGSWNKTLPANTSGQLYTWSGSAWVLHYTPYTYPYPTGGVSVSLGGSLTIGGNASLK